MNKSKDVEKKIIEELFQFVKENKFDIENDEHVKKVEDAVLQLTKIEIDNIGLDIKFNPDDYNNVDKNDVIYHFHTKENESDSSGSFVPNHLNTNPPELELNLYYFATEKLNSDDAEERVRGCKRMLHTVFHELRHYKQYLAVKQGISSKRNLTYARDFVIVRFKKSFYNKNYDSFAMENDANYNANLTYEGIMGQDRDLMRSEILYEGELETGTYEYLDNNAYGKVIRRDEIRDEVSRNFIDHWVKDKDNEIFYVSPLLLKEYNEDFTRKKPAQVIYEMKKEQEFLSRLDFISKEEQQELINDSKEMYYEILFNSLLKSDIEDQREMLKKFDMNEVKDILSNMEDYFEKEEKKKIRYAERMEVVETRPGGFPSRYFRYENPVEEMFERIDRISDYFRKKKDFLKVLKKGLPVLREGARRELIRESKTMHTNENKEIKQDKSIDEFRDSLKFDVNLNINSELTRKSVKQNNQEKWDER